MSERFLCLRCWRTPRRTEAYYQCAACDSGDTDPGAAQLPKWLPPPSATNSERRPVADLLPPRWRRWFSDARVPEFCPDHPKSPLVLYCPCGRPLSTQSTLSGKLSGLGFAGPRSSGKTFLTITAISALGELGSHRGSAPRVAPRRYGLLGFDGTGERFGKLTAQLLRDGTRPLPSPEVPGEYLTEDALELDAARNFAWRVYETLPRAERPVPRAVLAVYDVAGEVWGIPPHERQERLDGYLGLLGSLVFVLDGATIAADLKLATEDAWHPPDAEQGPAWTDLEWFSRVQERLGHLKRRRGTDLALVISKADHLWDAYPELKGEASQGALEDLLRRTGRSGIVDAGRAEFRRTKLFAASSLGFRPGPDDVDAEGRLVRCPEPIGVTAPLHWLLGERHK